MTLIFFGLFYLSWNALKLYKQLKYHHKMCLTC